MKIKNAISEMNETELFNFMHNFNNFIGNSLKEKPFDKKFVEKQREMVGMVETIQENTFMKWMTEDEKELFKSLS